MEEIYELNIPNKNQTKKYTITSAMRLNVFGKLIEMVETVNASLTFISVNNHLNFYYKQTGYKRESNNEKFFTWAAIINSLLSEFQATCDNTGKITQVSITNLDYKSYKIKEQLEANYKNNKHEIKELMNKIETFASDKKNIIKQLSKSGFHQVLFSGNYGKYTINQPEEEKRLIENLVNDIDIPVLLEGTFQVDKNQSQYTLTKNGALDTDNFDKKSLTRWLKDMTDTYNLKVDCGADVEEIYVYDKEHWIKQADSYFSFLAANLYECSFAYQIIQDKEEKTPKPENNTGIHHSLILD